MILMRQCAKAVNNPVAHAPSFQTTVLLVKQDITCWMVLVSVIVLLVISNLLESAHNVRITVTNVRLLLTVLSVWMDMY